MDVNRDDIQEIKTTLSQLTTKVEVLRHEVSSYTQRSDERFSAALDIIKEHQRILRGHNGDTGLIFRTAEIEARNRRIDKVLIFVGMAIGGDVLVRLSNIFINLLGK